MGTAMVVGLLLAFLPAIVALGGANPVWKFLSFLFCVFSLFGLVAFVVPGVLCWVIAWIFAGVSVGSGRKVTYVKDSTLAGEPRVTKEGTGTNSALTIAVVAAILVAAFVFGVAPKKEIPAGPNDGAGGDILTPITTPSLPDQPAPTPSSLPPHAAITPSPEERKETARQNFELTNFTWTKGGFDSVMMATFTFNNKNAFDIKDVEVLCRHTAPSGTAIDSNTRTIYDVVKAGSKKTIRDFNMGFIHSQVAKSNCVVDDFAIVDAPVAIAKPKPLPAPKKIDPLPPPLNLAR